MFVSVMQKGRAVARTTAESNGCRGRGDARSKSKGKMLPVIYFFIYIPHSEKGKKVRYNRGVA